jgi:hypothetical protein
MGQALEEQLAAHWNLPREILRVALGLSASYSNFYFFFRTMNIMHTKTPSTGDFLGHLARSFFNVLGEFATKVDELPLEAKQEIKEGFIRLMSISGRHDASIKLLTQEDNELSRILSAHGWWILPRDINGPVKRELLRLGREQKAAEIDSYICSLFSQNGGARLSERIGAWFNLAYLSDRKQIILDSLEAHKAGKWTLSVPTLLPLIDGIMRRFRKSYLRPSKNPRRLVSAERFAGYYRRKQPKLFGTSFAKFLNDHMFANQSPRYPAR